MPKWFKFALQALVSALLIGFALRQIELERLTEILRDPQHLFWIFAALLAFNASKIVAALRLNIYQRHAAIHLSETENLRLYYAGMFLNMFLPGGIGGDGYKALVLKRSQETPFKKILLILLADRVSGLLALVFLLGLIAPLASIPVSAALIALFAAFCCIAALAAFYMGHKAVLDFDSQKIRKVFLSALATQFLQIVCMIFLLAYVRVPESDYFVYCAIFLVSSIAAVLPISFGGLGIREVTFLFLLKQINYDPFHGIVASSLFFLISFISSLAGALFVSGFAWHPARDEGRA